MRDARITLAMGGGGTRAAELVRGVFIAAYGNDILNRLEDAAEFVHAGARLAFTTDAYTVKPLFFPGGDIGLLAVCGAVNDLAAKGALALALSAAFIIEEGFPVAELERIALSMRDAAAAAGARIVTGDTKVVGRGEADGLFIAVSGTGCVIEGMQVSCRNARRGDRIIISGTIADHGMAILNARQRLGFVPEIRSDVAPLARLVESLAPFAPSIHSMRDPTRGGVGGILNEIARASRVTMRIAESSVPLRPEVRASCALLGIDPLYMASEGRMVVIADRAAAGDIVRLMRTLSSGRDAAVIGSVEDSAYDDAAPPVRMETAIGAERFVPLLEGDPLPRIC